jgi:hypothetical protein
MAETEIQEVRSPGLKKIRSNPFFPFHPCSALAGFYTTFAPLIIPAMLNETTALRKIFSSVFETALLLEMEEKSILITAHAGQTLINMGQSIRVVPIVLSGTLKISGVKEDGQELLL